MTSSFILKELAKTSGTQVHLYADQESLARNGLLRRIAAKKVIPPTWGNRISYTTMHKSITEVRKNDRRCSGLDVWSGLMMSGGHIYHVVPSGRP